MTATTHRPNPGRFELVVMIGSLGGLQAASTVLAGLPTTFPVPVVLLLHGNTRTPVERQVVVPLLQRVTELPVRTTAARMRLQPGVFVLPHGSTGTFAEDGRLHLLDATATTGGDALFEAAATATESGLIGVVLTGLLRDGAKGVRAVKRHGGRVLAEDPRTARADGMPTAAIASGCVDFVLPVQRMASALVALTMAPGGADLLSVPTPAWAMLA